MSEVATKSTSPDPGRFQQVLSARHPCIAISTYEEEDALLMVREAALEAGGSLWLWSINGGVRDGLISQGTPVPDTEHPAAALYHLLIHPARCVVVMLDLAGHLKDERTLRLLRDLIEAFRQSGSTLVLIDHLDQMPAVIKATAHEFELSLPDEAELEQLVLGTLRKIHSENRLEVDLTRQGLNIILRNLRGLTRRQARQIISSTVSEDHRFDLSDLNRILSEKRNALKDTGLLEYVEAPTALDQIGGLKRLKAWLQQREKATASAAAVEFGLTAPRGLLLLGVQGAGKSLACKAVATAWRLPLMRMDVGALYDKYIGESEKRLRDSLRQAETMAPLVLWIDEIEKAFASAASRSSDGGLSQRMFGTMLTWMQERSAPVFTIATANDIEALPPELLRKGRFDEIFFVDLPEADAREQIFRIHLSKRKRDPAKFEMSALVSASAGYSGAEIEQAIMAAMHEAFSGGVEVTTRHVLDVLKASPPLSVTMAERVAELREWAKGRCVPAD
jgi:SpoVK/Ycf46/Vps4 family AAA+-type ATPase